MEVVCMTGIINKLFGRRKGAQTANDETGMRAVKPIDRHLPLKDQPKDLNSRNWTSSVYYLLAGYAQSAGKQRDQTMFIPHHNALGENAQIPSGYTLLQMWWTNMGILPAALAPWLDILRKLFYPIISQERRRAVARGMQNGLYRSTRSSNMLWWRHHHDGGVNHGVPNHHCMSTTGRMLYMPMGICKYCETIH
jgi:hypothetical protein